jgi:hypothetical protein
MEGQTEKKKKENEMDGLASSINDEQQLTVIACNMKRSCASKVGLIQVSALVNS